jgi:hypothetical protein
MALALDGTVQSGIAASAKTVVNATGLSTTNAGDIIIVEVTAEWVTAGAFPSACSVAVTSGTAVTSAWTARPSGGHQNSGGQGNAKTVLFRFWAYAASALTLTKATVTFTATTNFDAASMVIYAVTGFTGTAYETAPFDSNAALPAIATATTATAPTVTGVSTTAAATMLIASTGTSDTILQTAGAMAGTTGTLTKAVRETSSTNASSLGAENRVVAAAQTSVSIAFAGAPTGWIIIADALAQAGGAVAVAGSALAIGSGRSFAGSSAAASVPAYATGLAGAFGTSVRTGSFSARTKGAGRGLLGGGSGKVAGSAYAKGLWRKIPPHSPVVPVNIGTASNTLVQSTCIITVGAGGVPAGSTIVVCVAEAAYNVLDAVADSALNNYAPILSVGVPNPFASIYYCANASALVNGNNITFTKGSSTSGAVSAFYVPGLAGSPLDVNVSASASGISTPPSVTSGVPVSVGELIIGVVAVASGPGDTFTQDATNAAYAAPPNRDNATSVIEIVGGSVINSGSSALTYAPSITSRRWAALIVGFKTKELSGPDFFGVGPLAATAFAAAKFVSSSSLAAAAIVLKSITRNLVFRRK